LIRHILIKRDDFEEQGDVQGLYEEGDDFYEKGSKDSLLG